MIATTYDDWKSQQDEDHYFEEEDRGGPRLPTRSTPTQTLWCVAYLDVEGRRGEVEVYGDDEGDARAAAYLTLGDVVEVLSVDATGPAEFSDEQDGWFGVTELREEAAR